MKNLILISFLLINFFNLFSQTKYPGLYSEDYEKILNELESIVVYNDQEAIDILHSLIEGQTPYIQLNYLRILSLLNDGEIIKYCNDFIFRTDIFSTHEYKEDPLEMRVEATKLLMENGNFSTIDYVFEYFDLYKPDFNSLQSDIITLFPLIANKVPSTLNQLENDLDYVFNNSTIGQNRFIALYTFDEIFGDKVLNLALTGIDDNDYSIRSLSLNMLVNYEYDDLNNLIKERILTDPGRSMRTKMVEFLLNIFGSPSDLKFVIDYQHTEAHPTSKSLMGFYIQKFIPPKPDTLDWNGLTTKLISYTDELFQYGWIANHQTKDFYSKRLEDIISLINQTNEIDSACAIMSDQLLPQAEQDLLEELITTEGYKFLHYYSVYIKDDIKEEFGQCP
jgi:hypothetical protein